MKKFVIIFVCMVFLSGCAGGGENKNSSITQDKPSGVILDTPQDYEGELTLDFSFGTRTGIYSGEIDNNGLPNGHGKFTSENSTGETWTYEGDWVAGHWEGNGTATWANGRIYSGEFINDSETGHGTFTMETGERYEGTFASGVIYGEGTVYYPDGAYFIGTFTDLGNAIGEYYDKDEILYEATVKDGELSLRPLNDFFSDEERQNQYNTLYQSYRYSELAAYINEYLSENETSPLDSAYSILELINPVLEYENDWVISLDDFDSMYSLTFKDADNISSENSVVVSLKDTGLNIKLGFRKKGWVFFDNIAMSVDGGQVYSASVKSYDTTRNVISGNTIEEYCYCSFYDSVLEQVGNSENVILRFSNKDSRETFEHKLTQAEIDSLYCGLLLRINNRDLRDLLYRYNK